MKKYIVILIIIPALCASASAQSFIVDRYVIASGGGHSESGVYIIDGAIDQPAIGESSSDNYVVEAGFWVGGSITGNCVYIAGDVNSNGIPLELSDVMAMIGNYRGTLAPSYTCDCPGQALNFAAAADPGGNCLPFELNDVVVEIDAYRGTALASGCSDCPGSLGLSPGEGNQLIIVPSLKTRTVIGDRRTPE